MEADQIERLKAEVATWDNFNNEWYIFCCYRRKTEAKIYRPEGKDFPYSTSAYSYNSVTPSYSADFLKLLSELQTNKVAQLMFGEFLAWKLIR